MSRILLGLGALLVVISLQSCLEEPIPNVYCDGKTYSCNDPTRPRCDLQQMKCVEVGDGGVDGDAAGCATSAECSENAPVCGNGTCRACAGEGDDSECQVHRSATPRCDGASGKCVACRAATQATDCPTSTAPICGTDGSCRGCQAHSECPTGVCKESGACAQGDEIAYVNNTNSSTVTCDDNAHVSTPEMPYCQVQAAAEKSGKSIIVVAGSATAYGGLVVPSTVTSLVVVGPGMSASPTARLFTQAQPSVKVDDEGGTSDIHLSLFGLDLGGDANGKATIGVLCTNGGSKTVDVRVDGTSIHDCSGEGIQSSKCSVTMSGNTVNGNGGAGVSTSGGSVTMSGNTVSGNQGGGVSTSGGRMTVSGNTVSGNQGGGVYFSGNAVYAIVNNFIVDNGAGTLPGVKVSDDANGYFAFNTVAKNHRTGTNAGGIDCAGANQTILIERSIVWQNDLDGNDHSTTDRCELIFTDVDDTTLQSGRGNLNLDPQFKQDDYHLSGASPCKDVVSAGSIDGGASSPPTKDIDGDTRPQGNAWDIGADEAK